MNHLFTHSYLEYDWKPWKFENIPNNYWNDEKHQRNFLECLSKHLGINKVEDWYRV